MNLCPKCGADRAEHDTECPACGVIYARFEAVQAQRAAAEAAVAAEAARRANIEALMNEGNEPTPAPETTASPPRKKSQSGWVALAIASVAFIVALPILMPGDPRPPSTSSSQQQSAPEIKRPKPIATEGQWFDLTGDVIGCLTAVQLQRALDIYKSGDLRAAEQQMREYFDDETCVMLKTPMRVYVEATQGPYARVRKQGSTAAAWIVMPKR